MTDETTISVTHRVPVALLVALTALADELDRPRSRLMNEAYADLLHKYERERQTREERPALPVEMAA